MAYWCPVLKHGVAQLSVCRRRSSPLLSKIYPRCVGCDCESVLEDVPHGGVRIVYSEPPKYWFNMDKYQKLLGKEVCSKGRTKECGAFVGLSLLKQED